MQIYKKSNIDDGDTLGYGSYIVDFLETQNFPLEADPTVLYHKLTKHIGTTIFLGDNSGWPGTPSVLSRYLKNIEEYLLKAGYGFKRNRSGSKGRTIKFFRMNKSV